MPMNCWDIRFFKGTVIEGNKLGRTLGFPTANLQINNKEKLVPGHGVYAVELEILKKKSASPAGSVQTRNHEKVIFEKEIPGLLPDLQEFSSRFKGMLNIGVRPTIDGQKQVVEVHIFNFNQDIYGSELQVHFMHFLRKEQKFQGLNALKAQLNIDRENAITILSP